MFDLKNQVALIEKQRPNWQRGRLNGIGGKVEPNEDPYQAMVREFKEETGCFQPIWYKFAQTAWATGYVDYFVCRSSTSYIETKTDEKVGWWSIKEVLLNPESVIPNLRWAIPMALEYLHEPFFAAVNYCVDPATKQINASVNPPSKEI